MPKTKSQRQPNIIVFLTDQQRWDTTGVHGNPLDLTPTFDRIAQEGTHVFNSFTCQPLCGPARSCLQTGIYPTVTGCFSNRVPLPPTQRTLAHYFREAGYQTGYIGKWHLAKEEPVSEEKRGGYAYWLGANLLEFVSDAYDVVLYDNGNHPVRLPGYRVDALTDRAISFVATHQDEPFFLFLSHVEPHHQNHIDGFSAPEGYRERYTGKWTPPDLAALNGNAHQNLGGYYGMVKRLDEALARLLDCLTSLSLRENTVLLFTSDHGCHFKTRNEEYKRSCHDSSIRVPTALVGPGFNGGGRLQELVSLIDLPPTLLDVADIPIPNEMQGRSFLPLLGRNAQNWPQDVFIQISEAQIGRSLRTHRWKYSVIAPDKNGWDHSGAEHYVEDFLYDLDADPYELTNLVGYESHQHVAAELRKRLTRRMVMAGEEKPVIDPAPSVPTWQRHVPQEEHYILNKYKVRIKTS